MSAYKRLNPETNMPFKRGDTRDDGWIFQNYKVGQVRKDGSYSELWLNPITIKTLNEKQRKRTGQKRLSAERGKHLKRRVNPITRINFKLGDRDEKGRYFISYRNFSHNGQFFIEEWASEERWHTHHISAAVSSARKRARKLNIPFQITRADAQSIFPKDFKCPALGIKMYWGIKKSKFSSPSLDRIIPEKGYIKGNICWLSLRANIIKSDASAVEIQKVAKYLMTFQETKK